MRTIYIDSEFYCHTTNPDGSYQAVETNFFDGKCDTFVEGHSYKPYGEKGYAIMPWKPYSELDAAQRAYERQLIAEYEATLANTIPISDIEAAYQEGVDSAYDQE